MKKEEASQRWPKVTFTGDILEIGEGAKIGEGTRVGAGAMIGAKAEIGKNVWIGEGAWISEGADIGEKVVIGVKATVGVGALIGEGAKIRAKAEIGEGAVICEGAEIREGADIFTICSKYACNIVPFKDHISIRIGCESLPVTEFVKSQDDLAAWHDQEWWDKTGKRIFDFLVEEARRAALTS